MLAYISAVCLFKCVFLLLKMAVLSPFMFLLRLLVVLTMFISALFVLEALGVLDSMLIDLRRWNTNSIARVC